MGSIPAVLITSRAMNQYNLFFCAAFQSAIPFQHSSQTAKSTNPARIAGESCSVIGMNAIMLVNIWEFINILGINLC